MIDLHAHLLPGIDDGPPDLQGALALAAAAAGGGTRVMAATPHIGFQHGVAPGELAGRVAVLREALVREGIALEAVTGGELAPDRALDLTDDELRAIALGGSRCILLECPFTRAGDLMSRLVAHLQMKGFRVLLGHPERSPAFLADLDALAELVRRGAFVQLTAGSLRGDFGRTVQRGAHGMLERRLVHVVASDAHAATGRSPSLEARLAPDQLALLCEAAPRALLADADMPAPLVTTRRRKRRLRG
jgi:protein-tyrosine phosphatase